MTTKLRLTLGLLLLAPVMAHALGLGELRLGSGLNQPLAADIEIVGATSEELVQLRAGLPAREMFTRYGVDRPAYLSGFTFTVGKDASGRAILKVRTSDPLTEPFVTFLVEITWPRGHLIREYTALLDPPVFENKQPAPAPVAAAQTGATTGPAAGTVERAPEAAPAPAAPTAPAMEAPATAAPAGAPAAAATPGISGSEYRVVARDTLSQIAHRAGAVTRGDVNRLMLATFRANPTAFEGNINRLHKGALLKIPGSDEWGTLDAAAANREVSRQYADWRQAAGERSAGETGRLRLVPPAEKPAPGPSPAQQAAQQRAADAKAAAEQKAAAEKAAAEQKAAEQKRLLELRNEALAQAQQQAKPAPATTAQPPAAQPSVANPAATPTPAEAPSAAAETKPAAKPAVKPPTEAAEPGLVDTLLSNWIYLAAGVIVIALGALFLLSSRRRRRADKDFDQAMQPAAEPVEAPSPPTRIRTEAPREAMLVQESEDDSGEFVAPPIARVAPKQDVTATASIEDTLSSETAINLEQADPLAEADFHMAYGLYDQAADIVKLAIGREPTRRDLKLKLLEVYFVWGNKDAFLDVARDLGRTRDAGTAGEWDKVVIMGRQIAGEDPLFAGAAARSAATDVDLDLEAGGGQGVDLELLGDAPASAKPRAGEESIDLDLSQALAGGDGTADTGESATLDPDRLDMLLEGEKADHSGGTTREMRPHQDAPTVEQPALRSSADAPTVETPVLAERDGAIRDKLDSALRRERNAAADATAELSLDDLGFEVDKLGSTSTSIPALAVTDHPSDAPTMVAGLDDHTRALLAAAEQNRRAADLEPTRETPRRISDLEPTRETPRPAPDATQRLPGKAVDTADTGTARVLGTTGLDLDLDELARALETDTVEQPRREEVKFSSDVFQTAIRKAPNGLDLDVGAPLNEQREPTVTERINADELSLPELEPVTLSEVGTKLDLARAYMDMGDPDGARSILQEVLTEGSASQKQEAQRLIETLPG